jgi:hypothetical protein
LKGRKLPSVAGMVKRFLSGERTRFTCSVQRLAQQAVIRLTASFAFIPEKIRSQTAGISDAGHNTNRLPDSCRNITKRLLHFGVEQDSQTVVK